MEPAGFGVLPRAVTGDDGMLRLAISAAKTSARWAKTLHHNVRGFWSLPFLQSEQHLPKRICHILKFSSKLKTPYLLRLNKQFVRCCIIKRWHFEQPATNPQHRFPTIQEARLYFITLSYMFKLQIIIVYLNCLPWNWLTLRLLISETSKNSSVKTHLIKNLLNNNVFHLPFWQNVDIHRSR